MLDSPIIQLNQGKLPPEAFIFLLDDMLKKGEKHSQIETSLRKNDFSDVYPYSILAAIDSCPDMFKELSKHFFKNCNNHIQLKGKTYIVVNVSHEMEKQQVKGMSLMKHAAFLTAILKEISYNAAVSTFSSDFIHIQNYTGYDLVCAILQSQKHEHHSPQNAFNVANAVGHKGKVDRTIIITNLEPPKTIDEPYKNGYIINVDTDQDCIIKSNWTIIRGFSTRTAETIVQLESEDKLCQA